MATTFSPEQSELIIQREASLLIMLSLMAITLKPEGIPEAELNDSLRTFTINWQQPKSKNGYVLEQTYPCSGMSFFRIRDTIDSADAKPLTQVAMRYVPPITILRQNPQEWWQTANIRFLTTCQKLEVPGASKAETTQWVITNQNLNEEPLSAFTNPRTISSAIAPLMYDYLTTPYYSPHRVYLSLPNFFAPRT